MTEVAFVVLLSVITLVLVFDFINGFHDAANAIATVVATRVLNPQAAVIYGAVLNFIGSLMGTQVAATIGRGLIDERAVPLETILIAVLAAILWNLYTWYKAWPSSSTFALLGSLLGATYFSSPDGLKHIHLPMVVDKVLIPMLLSPLCGLLFGFVGMTILYWLIYRMDAMRIKQVFGKLQILSAGFMALSHGHNDAQKSMGIIALALVAVFPGKQFEVPLWIMLLCAIAMGLGTLTGGWRIIRTMGTRLIKIRPIHGFAAETTAATIIMTASHMGIPLSTTHVISSSIAGVGAAKRWSAVNWPLASQIVRAWVFSMPVTFVASGLLMIAYRFMTE